MFLTARRWAAVIAAVVLCAVPVVLACSLFFSGSYLLQAWSVKTAAEIRLEQTDYTYAVAEALGTTTYVGKAFGLNFLSNCQDVGVVSTYRTGDPGEAGYLQIKVLRRESAGTPGPCDYLLIGMSGRQTNVGHQIPDGALVGNYEYRNENNDHDADTLLLLRVTEFQRLDTSIGSPPGWRDVALLAFRVDDPHTYLGGLGRLFARQLPFSRTFEVVVGTYQPRLIDRLEEAGGAVAIVEALKSASFGLGAFIFGASNASQIEVVSSGGHFGLLQREFEPARIFPHTSVVKLNFGASRLAPTGNSELRGWLLERPVNYRERQTFAVTIGGAIIGLALAFLSGYVLELIGFARRAAWRGVRASTHSDSARTLVDEIDGALREKEARIEALRSSQATLSAKVAVLEEELSRAKTEIAQLRKAKTE
jgi:hypothetical protein